MLWYSCTGYNTGRGKSEPTTCAGGEIKALLRLPLPSLLYCSQLIPLKRKERKKKLESKHFFQELIFILLEFRSGFFFWKWCVDGNLVCLSGYTFSLKGISDNLLTQCIMERVGGRSQARLLAGIKEVLMPSTLIGLRQYPPA